MTHDAPAWSPLCRVETKRIKNACNELHVAHRLPVVLLPKHAAVSSPRFLPVASGASRNWLKQELRSTTTLYENAGSPLPCWSDGHADHF